MSCEPVGRGKRNTGISAGNAREIASPDTPRAIAVRWVRLPPAGPPDGAAFLSIETRKSIPVSAYAGDICQRGPSARTCARPINIAMRAICRIHRATRSGAADGAKSVSRSAIHNRVSRNLIAALNQTLVRQVNAWRPATRRWLAVPARGLPTWQWLCALSCGVNRRAVTERAFLSQSI